MTLRLSARPWGGATQFARLALAHAVLVAIAALVAFSSSSRAQLPPTPPPLSNTEDARVLPKGTIMLRGLTAWTRFGSTYGGLDSTHEANSLDNAFQTDTLGVRQLPQLAPSEAALRTLTGNANLKLSVGSIISVADSRVVTVPIALEYGLTSRLTLGLMVPVLQTRTTLFVELNPQFGPNSSNVGPNPALFPQNTTALGQNQAVVASLDLSRQQLQTALQGCQTNPTAPVCSRQAEANQVIATTTAFSDAIRTLYGTAIGQGGPFVPRGTTQTGIAARLVALNAQYVSLLGAGTYVNGAPAGAAASAANEQLQQLAISPPISLDSIGSPERISLGDIQLGAALNLFDSFRDTTRHTSAFRATLQGNVRFPTGGLGSASLPFDIGTGAGQTGVTGRAIIDARFGRVVTTALGQYTAFLGSANVTRLPNTEYSLFPWIAPRLGAREAGNVIQAELTPRFMLTDYFTINGHYSFFHQGAASYTASDGAGLLPTFAASTEQRLGIGFGYSMVGKIARGKASILPIELTFAHVETFYGSGGLTPKTFTDQIEARIYYRLLRRD